MKVDLQQHEFLKFQLRLAGSSMAKIAQLLGISQSSVTVVSQGYRRSHRVQLEIAEHLGTTPEALFPDRYTHGRANQPSTTDNGK
ncbi:helix-turn-helix domain-containing protein [Falsirhodobacter sp. alg1]|uniref:helix-turn-helix domain-containing protein n=1 Tax=Falsirhodobacter sp. alg1 TaxID=1472418 RepID=UPI0005EFDB5E|nr:helix-turn-helix domain-containing protein [Falsirhodobacter sp. alg1]